MGPVDGLWEVDKSWGLAHGVFALEMRRRRERPMYTIACDQHAKSWNSFDQSHNMHIAHGFGAPEVEVVANDELVSSSGPEVIDLDSMVMPARVAPSARRRSIEHSRASTKMSGRPSFRAS